MYDPPQHCQGVCASRISTSKFLHGTFRKAKYEFWRRSLQSSQRSRRSSQTKKKLTYHTTIIARELQKPCVIETKVATTFRDGDMVEVDATKGTVAVIS